MSNNGDEAKIAITCNTCGQHFSAKLPEGDVFNTIRASGFVAAHDRLIKCLCGSPFMLQIAVIPQVGWTVVPVVDPEIITQMEGTRILRPKGLIQH